MVKSRFFAAFAGFLSLAALAVSGLPASAAPVSTGMTTSAESSVLAEQELIAPVQYYRQYRGRGNAYGRRGYGRGYYGRGYAYGRRGYRGGGYYAPRAYYRRGY